VTDIKLPLGLSVAAHAVVLTALIMLLPATAPPLPIPPAMGGVEVVFAPPPPQPVAPPVQVETPPPPVETPPPEPQPSPPPDEPVAVTEPPPPALEAPAPLVEPPPPPAPHKPVVKHPPKPVIPHPEQPPPTPAFVPTQPAPAQVAPQQTAMAPTPVPAPVPSPEVSPGYLALLSAWLNSHKRYPDTARERGEEGRAVLHFDVDRSGRVLDFAVIKSSGYPDLDAAIEEMMRGATLPPFPAGMTESRLPVSVTIRFSLTR
jgi:periplasmic protein TonB